MATELTPWHHASCCLGGPQGHPFWSHASDCPRCGITVRTAAEKEHDATMLKALSERVPDWSWKRFTKEAMGGRHMTKLSPKARHQLRRAIYLTLERYGA